MLRGGWFRGRLCGVEREQAIAEIETGPYGMTKQKVETMAQDERHYDIDLMTFV